MQKGVQNLYLCQNGPHQIGTDHRESGTTPMFISCPICGHRASSTMGQIIPPTIHGTWVTPTAEEMEKHIDQCEAQYPDTFTREELRGFAQDHIDMGGTVCIWIEDPAPCARL